MGWMSQRTATLETTAQMLTLSPRSTSTGKVAADAQTEMQTLSARPQRRSGSLKYHGCFTGFFAFFQNWRYHASRVRRMHAPPATVPSTAAKESSKPISHTA